MSKSYFSRCPRCGTGSYEQLLTHGHCIECLYSEDLADSGKRDFMTLKEAEALLAKAEIHFINKESKKVSEVAS